MRIMSVVVVHYIFCFIGSLILFYSVSDDVRKTPLWVVIVCTPLVMIVFYLILFFVFSVANYFFSKWALYSFTLFSVSISFYIVSYLYVKYFAKDK